MAGQIVVKSNIAEIFQPHLHVVQNDVSKFPSLPLINVSSMLGAELHKHPHTC